jgi:hypothetical protein
LMVEHEAVPAEVPVPHEHDARALVAAG